MLSDWLLLSKRKSCFDNLVIKSLASISKLASSSSLRAVPMCLSYNDSFAVFNLV